ncbi:hypothetical protein HNR44_002379 [Geomicrobium halophilum]|uniref:BZIP transcription factor n=1 Tax=Geomicrobium halophilum TaxID=549000 RepID=A0A841PT82_9BACL|nr:hypothetical protein [Geomicrobium halophilum]MBB6450396.1 hypothetical protein [Geomicrobium halophilum]
MIRKLAIGGSLTVFVFLLGSLLMKNDMIANASPVIASVDWVLEQLAPFSDRISDLEEEIKELEEEVEQLKAR